MDEGDICTVRACVPGEGTTMYPGRIDLKTTEAIGFVIDGNLLAAQSIRPGTHFVLSAVSFESDTIPAPLPPGPIEALFRSVGGRTALNAVWSGATGFESDTIPGPMPGPAPEQTRLYDFNGDGTLDVLVLASAGYLKNRKALTSQTSGFILEVRNGKTVEYTSGLISAGIIGPEIVK